MSQINRYPDRAAYEADEERLSTKSAVSLIGADNEVIYDGVNVVVEKAAAVAGDLAVYDTAAGVIRFVRGGTLLPAQLPATLVPLAVVYARQGARVLIVSLDNAMLNGATSIRWGAPYEVALSGFDLAAGGTFTLRINNTDYSFTYPSGATLGDIAAQLNANSTIPSTYGWETTADTAASRLVMAANTWSPDHTTIGAASGCTLIRTPEDRNYQVTPTGLLTGGRTTEYIRRRNRINTHFAGCNPEKFLKYYSVNGGLQTEQKPGSSTIIRESAFTGADNPELVAVYPTYRDYLLGEHMMQHPCTYGVAQRNGRTSTELIGMLRFTDIRGDSAPCYPAAASALAYGVTVEDHTTGLEAGAWWLPSVDEVYMLMHDRALSAAGAENDPVNRTLLRQGGTACYGSGYYLWTSCELNSSNSFFYNGSTGTMQADGKANPFAVRPVSVL